MRAVDVAQLSTRMFKTNPLRTWLTILGMGVGTAAVVILVGLGFGLQKIILEEIEPYRRHLFDHTFEERLRILLMKMHVELMIIEKNEDNDKIED